jgi:hypothetical protein
MSTFFELKVLYSCPRVLCNAKCAANVVVDDNHHNLFSCIMDYLHLVFL